MHSRAFGLKLHADQAIPGLVETPASRVDVRVRMGCLPPALPEWERAATHDPPWYTCPHADPSGQPLLTVRRLAGDSHYQFRYADGTRFVVDRSGTEVWTTWPDALTLADAATYLLGPVLGFVLRLRGRVCLHGSGAIVGGSAWAFVGPAGAGKSTTAAALARRGFPVICDDIVALEEGPDGFRVLPAYPQLRLWPNSVEMLYGDAAALPRLTPNWDKRGLDLNGGSFPEIPLPLGAIYLLGERRDDADAPYVEAVPPAEALPTLVANTFMNYLLDRARRGSEFAALGRLLARVPVRRVFPHADAARLPDLCAVILESSLAAGG